MPDFTFRTFRLLLTALKAQHYTFQTFAQFLRDPASRAIILRHDVDARKLNSLHAAGMEAEMGIAGTFNFRIVHGSYDEEVIRHISAFGHEIGYHYEDLAIVRGDTGKAITLFELHLVKLRRIVPIETICMHGSPLSKYDNRKLWEKYDYRKYGILGEPYFDIDFSKVLYLTDTGRRWDGGRVSVRDRINDTQPTTTTTHNLFHSTFDIIHAANNNLLPNQIMITVHPQRWDDRILPWTSELILQNLKNVIKRMVAARARKD